MKYHISRSRLRVSIVVIALVMIAAAGTPTASAQQDVSFEYDSEPAGSVNIDTGDQYTHTFDVQTNATNGPLIMTVYYNTSADFTYDSHTVRVNGSTTIPTQLAVDTITVDGQNLTRIQLTNRSVTGNKDRRYNTEVKLSVPSNTGDEVVYSGGTHGPSGEVIPLKETAVTIQSSGGGVSTVETGGGGGGGGGPPRIINEGPPEVPDVRSTLKLASTQTVVEVQTGGSSTVSPDASTTVSEIAFNADSVDTTVVVKEYGDPPTRVAEEITTSAQSDGVDISSEDDIISLTSVSTDLSAQADDSAIITLTIDRERVDSPASLVVVKDKYSFEQQQETWVAKPTTVTDASNERVVIETAVDEFSMLAVVEKDSAGGGKTSPNESESTSNTSNNETDSSIPLPLFLPVVAIILSASLFAVRE